MCLKEFKGKERTVIISKEDIWQEKKYSKNYM
jgi:hypothetical protein